MKIENKNVDVRIKTQVGYRDDIKKITGNEAKLAPNYQPRKTCLVFMGVVFFL